MTPLHDAGLACLLLPPGFSARLAERSPGAHLEACRLAAAGQAEPATLVIGRRDDLIEFSVVLAPDEPLASARRAFFAGMVALGDAVGAYGPPEMPVTFDWDGSLNFNGARLGGGRLGWPEGCAEEDDPDWLVFSAALIGSKAAFGDPGHTPESTALDEEGFGGGLRMALIESFARHLTKAFEVWREDGFERIAAIYLSRWPLDAGVRASIDAFGDGRLTYPDGRKEHLFLRAALQMHAWFDPATGGVRL
ncbi:biotin/lipoate--protein ligase family protein [Methylobacterium gnaphalii]|uniref:BPL/LPL catalytic domain-containing protein n=1 Tax=Methylobacterium gnaphalii TaxID=1010610 RepID=A0A512JQG3_9HYPH|nr:biotin/lipoate--protein ligase family protein [Methylobacterium gnaphalii]GEP12182.1 hypothetical protein MGN01_40270 [Methylobacterium gnaphalii]GJD67478.1 hypothetical protein MMMDOFMJ_0393 [Methylobacterium gnaphalii]GLS51304.1 hypothetical protein GCM10007885_41590 [Methylobacterium gnaphalii]